MTLVDLDTQPCWPKSKKKAKYTGTTFAAAAAFLAGGKAKTYRPVSSNGYLAKQHDGSISFVLYDTAIITYHEDGTYTLDHGGWRTTQTSKGINAFTPFRIGSTYDRKFPGWSLGDTGERTPARVQKCRSCSGLGGTVSRRECSGASWHSWYPQEDKFACQGARTEYHIPWKYGEGEDNNWQEHCESHYTVPCEHGAQFTERHRLTLCAHGNRGRHMYGEVETHECYRCDGEGVVDYGSKMIPIIWGNSPARMAADGSLITQDAPRYYAPSKPYKPSIHTSWTQHYTGSPAANYVKAKPKHTYGSETNTVLESLLPGLRTSASCPACTGGDAHTDKITNLVIHLNDKQRWTRESIADWLDTLSADLRFPLPIGA